MRRIGSRFIRALSILTLLNMVALAAIAQAPKDVHPEKTVYADLGNWPVTEPGQVELKSFRPFRAVYDRQYTQSQGSGAGEKRQDRVIVSTEEVAWYGERAVAIMVIDSGAAKYADTNMRSLLMVTAIDDLRALFEIGPVPGKAKDYYLALFTGEEALLSTVMTEAQEYQPRKMPTQKPGFGPGSWVMASMKLEEGMKIQLAPYYSPQANPISQSSHGRVIGRKTMTDGSGQERSAWVVETNGWYGPTSPKVLRLYLQDSPPYYLGTEIFNHDTGESKQFVWLRNAQVHLP